MVTEPKLPAPFLTQWCVSVLKKAGYGPNDLNTFMHMATLMTAIGREFPTESLQVLEQNSLIILEREQKFGSYYSELVELGNQFIDEFQDF